MGSESNDKSMMVTQVSIGGFGNDVNATTLVDYLKQTSGQVWRCRLKRSSTPPDAYPEFNVDVDQIRNVNDYKTVKPHAFVHFVHPDSVNMVLEAAGKHELLLNNNILKATLGPENPSKMNQIRSAKTGFKLSDVVLEIGLLTSRDNFVVGWRGPASGVDFLIDPFDCSCKFLFTKETVFYFERTKNHTVIKCNFKVEFSLRDVNDIQEYKDYSKSVLVLVFQLASSPFISYRTADDDITKTYPYEMLDDDDPWIRTTDFTPSSAIGRCNTYRIMIRTRDGSKVKKALDFFKEQSVRIEHRKTLFKVENEPEFGSPIPDPFFSIHYKQDIPFRIMFLVNSVLHRCIINQHHRKTALKHICSYRNPLYDVFTQLKNIQEWFLNNPKLIEKHLSKNDVIEVRRLIITPTKAYCLPPEVELSNRVLRHYREVSDRFSRVTFMDEGMGTFYNNVLSFSPAPIVKETASSYITQKTAIFRRVRNILSNGFRLSGRRYCFLNFSANQLRDRSAWFFAEDENISCNDIISWMGKFDDKNVAKCAARMGQCFSSTYATVDVMSHEIDWKIKDIKRNGYTFSDGIGKISTELALEVAERLQLKDNQPSAYQIRYAGCKGVVACWPDKNDEKFKLSLRPSMKKFESDHTVLEICSWTRFHPGFLNRQIITLLSSLNVKDEIFWDMQMKMVKKLDLMLENTDVAFDVVTASCAESGNTASIMLGSGFDPRTEPHLRGMLNSIRITQLEDLREKARIFVNDGRFLMGCFDELGVLEEDGSKFMETKRNLSVIKGNVVIAKNPCLHPGDVRVLKAVNEPRLEHLVDCLIFPQKGNRPHTDEASGSDLDGDLYFVTWDENLIPPSKQSWTPMEYTAAEAIQLQRDVTHSDIIDFFAKNMVNDSLGTNCNAHVVHADMSECGALDEKCIKLAELAATAVDFPKTGKIVRLPPQLKPKIYPDFMGKEDFQSYKSEKILGKLYRHVKDFYNADAIPSPELQILPSHVLYDKDLEILDSESECFLNDAWGCKLSYDRQLNGLLGQYKVAREEEIVTGHIWSMREHSSKKQGELKERIKHAYSALRKEFRKVFDHLGAEFNQVSEEDRNAVYEKKASAWYQVTYHPIWVKKSLEFQEPDREGEMVNLSFAWIAADYLARIKIKCRGAGPGKSSKPVDTVDRIRVGLGGLKM
ncbi:putative RNA-directed RNA polymerase [Helianthus anomalus]